MTIKNYTIVIASVCFLGIILISSIIYFLNSISNKQDEQRKKDIIQIQAALESYFEDRGKYPPAGKCSYGSMCSVFSTDGPNWISALVPKYIQKLPKDPKNTASKPWIEGNFSYAYGNVSDDGQKYDLTTQLENRDDPQRCGAKNYRFYFDNRAWCKAFGGPYSDQIYELSP